MNKLMVCFFVYFATLNSFYSQEVGIDLSTDAQFNEVKLQWSPTFKEALQKSKKEHKPILIYFTGSDWCGPCKILDTELFHTEKFKALSDRDLVLLEVDIPRRIDLLTPKKMSENYKLQHKYGVQSFPTLLMVNYKGKKLAEKKGYIMTEYYYPFIQSVIQKY
ncbi:thioredoxin family protein [Polaribacter litorisediminis]|uniref:thioredoxin family protein n=1 Tax=Polaribacter litorisediminis TaxID=1908341 RepID=UPI001CC1A09B|nr:thioredoxin fold domain-containing protein [Polaribacter litorisediminis]UAM98634.1 thioredoxin family protein [Polaribacter litorisediminis]